MTTRRILTGVCGAFAGLALVGCSFSASMNLNSEGKAVVTGKDAIRVAAVQPEAPPPPPPPKPVKKARVVLKKDKIEINEKVMFEFNKAAIKMESHGLLKEVAEVISSNPQLEKIRVEGHTDSDGSDKYNKKLSRKRAKAVKQFLVDAGIDPAKLEAVGYGEERPIADNATDEGKEKNRRVEFNIIAQAKPEGDKAAGDAEK